MLHDSSEVWGTVALLFSDQCSMGRLVTQQYQFVVTKIFTKISSLDLFLLAKSLIVEGIWPLHVRSSCTPNPYGGLPTHLQQIGFEF